MTAIIAIVIFFGLLFVAPRLFAALVGLAVVGAVLLAVTLYVSQQATNRRLEAETALGRTAPVDLTGLRLDIHRRDAISPGLTGQVVNLSPQLTVTSIQLRVRILEDGRTVGEEVQSLYVDVPPQQAREVNSAIWFHGLGAPRGARSWTYDVVSIRAHQ